HARLRLFPSRQIVYFTAVQAIAYADFDFIETIENIEFRKRQAVDAAGQYGLPHQYRVEPPAAAGPPCDDTALLAPFAKNFANRMLHLVGGERTESDPRRICLAYAEHIVDCVRP